MKKKALLLFGALLLAFCLCGFTYRGGTYIYDNTGSITESDDLNRRIDSMRESLQADVVVVMTETPSTSNYMQAAKQELLSYVSSTGGYGENGEAIMLYIDQANRRFAIVEHNASERYLLSDGEIDSMTDENSALTARLSSGDYNNACVQFLSYVQDAAKPGFFQTVFGWLTAALGVSGAATGIAVGAHKSRPMVSKRQYLNRNTFQTLSQEDVMTGRTQQVREIRKEEPPEAHVSSGDLGDHVHGGGGSF